MMMGTGGGAGFGTALRLPLRLQTHFLRPACFFLCGSGKGLTQSSRRRRRLPSASLALPASSLVRV
jgi:hypothetical protein